MIIESTAPSRVSLFGGGTDVAPYSTEHGGLVINMAINIRTHTTLYTGDDIYQPENKFPYKANPSFYYTILEYFRLNGMHLSKIQSEYDGLIESGLGSSASAAVALISAISKSEELNLSKLEIAEKAWELEVNKLKLFGGKQDQYVSALGGINVMEFKDKVSVTPLSSAFLDPLLPHLILFHVGFSRKNTKIQEGLKTLTKQKIKNLDRIKEIAVSAIDYVAHGDTYAVGKLLDETWKLKRGLNKEISNTEIDDIYSKALKSGAFGGKLLGSGGGGYIMFVCLQEDQEKLKKELELEWVDFCVDWNGVESRIL